MTKYFNPYSETDFFSFLSVLVSRFVHFLTGTYTFDDLAADEVQILILMGIALSGALVGTFLVLRKMTMLANALSHTILVGIVVASLVLMALGVQGAVRGHISLPLLFIASLVSSLVTTFLTEGIRKVLKLQEDASIGLVFTTLFALGILLVTVFARDHHVGTELVLGNVDALKKEDLKMVYFVSALTLLFFVGFFKEFKLTTFDPAFSRTLGLSSTFYHYLLMMLTSLTAISAFRAVGVLMLLAFLVGPTLIARLFTKNLWSLLLMSIFVGSIAAIVGVALSRHILTFYQIGLSTGGVVVSVLLLLYVLAMLFSSKGLLKAYVFKRKRVALTDPLEINEFS